MLDQITVRVRRREGACAHHGCRDRPCTSRFCAARVGGVLDVVHDVTADEVSDDLAELLVAELGGMLRDQDEFEAAFVGVVESLAGDRETAWWQFYANSLRRLESGTAAFAPVHAHAAALVVGREILDLGSCFGFFPLRLTAAGHDVTATDLCAATMTLLERTAVLVGRPLRTLACDAADTRLPDGSADTVTVLHLLEHLDPATGAAVIGEAVRLARRRVVVAVPFEDVACAHYGHVQRFDAAALTVIADEWRRRGVTATVGEFHGGWLILDHQPPRDQT